MVKFTHLISKEGENNCYIKYVLWKVFKNCIKLITSHFLVLQNCFTRRALKEQFVTQRTLQGHSKGTQRAFEHSGTRMALRHSATQGSWHLGTAVLEALGHSKGTWALGHSGTQGTWALESLQFPANFNKCFWYGQYSWWCRVTYVCIFFT